MADFFSRLVQRTQQRLPVVRPLIVPWASTVQMRHGETPLEQTPLEQTSAEQTPPEQTPLEQTPLEQTSAEQTPLEQTPLEQTSAEQTPLEQTSLEERSVHDDLDQRPDQPSSSRQPAADSGGAVPPPVPVTTERRSPARKTRRSQQEDAAAAPHGPVEPLRASVRREVNAAETRSPQAPHRLAGVDRELALPAPDPIRAGRQQVSRRQSEEEAETAAVVGPAEQAGREPGRPDKPAGESLAASPVSSQIAGRQLQRMPEPLIPSVKAAPITPEGAAASGPLADEPGIEPGIEPGAGSIAVAVPDMAEGRPASEPTEPRPPAGLESPGEEPPPSSQPAPLPFSQRAPDGPASVPLSAAPSSASPPAVKVTIGRIEVRVAQPAEAAPPRRPPQPRRPAVSLGDYLKRRNGGSR